MKILHVETGRHLYGGPQQVIYLVGGLLERGHDCMLVCPPDSGIDRAARLAGMPVRNLFCAGDLDLPFAYRLVQYLQKTRPDIVHCHSRRGADVLGGLAASFADIPAVVSRRVDNAEMRLLAALRYRPFSKIVAISDTVARVLREHDIEESRIEVIRSAVDTDRFSIAPDCGPVREAFGVPTGELVIAAAGQLIPRKGHRFLLQAAAELKETHGPFRLLIFGEGYLNNQLRAQAASLGLGDIVQFAGFRDDLDDFMGCIDIFVHPALTEGLGVIALKAAAAGVPVVGFAAGGMVEAVLHDKTGILVQPEDVSGLRDAIAALLDDDERRCVLGAAGRQRMQNEFSIATMIDKHVALYESVLHG
jgi:glycosyltransferase involved in cell wall biosynthesis